MNIVPDFHFLAILRYKISENLSFDILVKPFLESVVKIANFAKNVILHINNSSQYKLEKFCNK